MEFAIKEFAGTWVAVAFALITVPLAGALVSTASATPYVVLPALTSVHYMPKQITALVGDAHTPDSYGSIAADYEQRPSDSSQNAAEDMAEWARRPISVNELRSERTLHYSRADLKRLVKSAQTPEEFAHLAAYFDRQAKQYSTKSEAEERELARLLALPYHARSYPFQVQSTRNQIDHLKALSKAYSERGACYRSRAEDPSDSVPAQVPPTR